MSGYSSNRSTNAGQNCNACHSGGVTPTVVLSGPTQVAPGSTHTFSLAITGGQNVAGGQVSWTFSWTAPVDPGSVTLYGSGNSVNLANGFNGDQASSFETACETTDNNIHYVPLDQVGTLAWSGSDCAIG